mgnify:CR=1 FL=1
MMVIVIGFGNSIRYSLELCQFRCTEEEISNVNMKVYYVQITIIVFATSCAIFLRWRGPHKIGQGAACGPRAARWAALV